METASTVAAEATAAFLSRRRTVTARLDRYHRTRHTATQACIAKGATYIDTARLRVTMQALPQIPPVHVCDPLSALRRSGDGALKKALP